MGCWKKLKFWRRRDVESAFQGRSEELREESDSNQEQLEARVTELECVEATLRGRITDLEEKLREREVRRQCEEFRISLTEARFERDIANERNKVLEKRIREKARGSENMEANQKCVINELCAKLRRTTNRHKRNMEAAPQRRMKKLNRNLKDTNKGKNEVELVPTRNKWFMFPTIKKWNLLLKKKKSQLLQRIRMRYLSRNLPPTRKKWNLPLRQNEETDGGGFFYKQASESWIDLLAKLFENWEMSYIHIFILELGKL
jgi:hypothetical protein